MTKFRAWVFVVNGEELLHKAIRSLEYVRDVLTIVDNSPKGIGDVPFGTVYRPPIPLTFAQSQNYILQESRKSGCSFYLWIHHDAEAIGDSCQKMVELAVSLEESQKNWGLCFSSYDAFVAFNTKAFDSIGGWDEELTWYCGDVDAYRRLNLAGYELIESHLPVKHTPSQTLNSDPKIKREVDLMFSLREEYYIRKWGNSPGKETFTTPFGK